MGLMPSRVNQSLAHIHLTLVRPAQGPVGKEKLGSQNKALLAVVVTLWSCHEKFPFLQKNQIICFGHIYLFYLTAKRNKPNQTELKEKMVKQCLLLYK